MKRLIIILLFGSQWATAQDKKKEVLTASKYYATVRLGHMDDVVAFTAGAIPNLAKIPIRPRTELGIEKMIVAKKKYRISSELQLSWHEHAYQERVIGIGMNLNFQKKIFRNLWLAPKIGLHYNRSYNITPVYKYDANTKEWATTKTFYKPVNRLFVPLGVEINYAIKNKWQAILGAQLAPVTPYAPDLVAFYAYKGYYIGAKYAIW